MNMIKKEKVAFKDDHRRIYTLFLILLAGTLCFACSAFYVNLPKIPGLKIIDAFTGPTGVRR